MKNRTAPKRGKVKSQLLKRPLNGMTKAAHTRDVPKSQRSDKTPFRSALIREVLEQTSVGDLRNLCSSAGIRTTTKMRKAELIDLLVQS